MSRQMLSTLYCDSKLQAAIGSIAVESAYLERYIETMLYALTKISRDIGQPMIEGTMIGSKLDLLLHVGKVKLAKRPKRLKQFCDLMSRIKQANTDRTIAIHGVWQPEIQNWLRAYAMMDFGKPVATKRGKGQDTKMSAERAMKIAGEISELHYELHDFAEQTWRTVFPQIRFRKAVLPPVDRLLAGSHMAANTLDTPQSS